MNPLKWTIISLFSATSYVLKESDTNCATCPWSSHRGCFFSVDSYACRRRFIIKSSFDDGKFPPSVLVVLSGSSSLRKQKTSNSKYNAHTDCHNFKPSDRTSFLLLCQTPRKAGKVKTLKASYFCTPVSAQILHLIRLLRGPQRLHCCKLF